MLAKMAATVDAASQGRLIVGLGAGWNRREYDAFGFAYDRRVSRFEEAFTIIRRLLREGDLSALTTHFVDVFSREFNKRIKGVSARLICQTLGSPTPASCPKRRTSPVTSKSTRWSMGEELIVQSR